MPEQGIYPALVRASHLTVGKNTICQQRINWQTFSSHERIQIEEALVPQGLSCRRHYCYN
jgi:hypothetical protein